MPNARPYTAESLADHWGVSATSIRNLCQSGRLPHFRVGRLYRITAQTVEDYECQTSASDDSEADTASTGTMGQPDAVIRLRHARERKPRQKPSTPIASTISGQQGRP